MTDLTPAEWFDQFPPLAWNATWPTGSQWCPRHWAPCPELHHNGIGAATELMQIFLNELAPPEAKTPAALNRAQGEFSPLCCHLGDERMFEVWGHWPPSAPAEADGAKVDP